MAAAGAALATVMLNLIVCSTECHECSLVDKSYNTPACVEERFAVEDTSEHWHALYDDLCAATMTKGFGRKAGGKGRRHVFQFSPSIVLKACITLSGGSWARVHHSEIKDWRRNVQRWWSTSSYSYGAVAPLKIANTYSRILWINMIPQVISSWSDWRGYHRDSLSKCPKKKRR